MSFTGVRSLDKSALLFADRADAGRQLARTLSHLRGTDVVVLALPRGGVPVAYEVARELHAPLDVIVVSKLGVPFQPEYGFGAVGEGGVRIVDDRRGPPGRADQAGDGQRRGAGTGQAGPSAEPAARRRPACAAGGPDRARRG